MKTLQAKLRVNGRKTVPVEIPTDDEIARIADRMHAAHKPCLETILGWKVLYMPRREFTVTKQNIDPFTGEKGPKSAPSRGSTWTEFTFGYEAQWKIVLAWQAGDDQPPKWFRYEDKLVLEDTPTLL